MDIDSFSLTLEVVMNKRASRIPPALRHGVYSGMALLPGEDHVAYEKFRHDILTEYKPAGRSEEDIVMNMADLMWRRQNLMTYRVAENARDKYSSIYQKLSPPFKGMRLLGYEEETRSPEELRALRKQADEEAETELGPALELVEIGDVATTDYLLKEISIAERLDGMIDRCLKRLLFVRGLKSLSSTSSAASSPSRIRRAVAVVSIVLAIPIFRTYFEEGLVPRLPTAVLSTGLMLLAFLSLACGLILDTVTRGRRELKLIAHLALRAPGHNRSERRASGDSAF